MQRLLLLATVAILLSTAPLPAQSEERESAPADEEQLKNAYQNTDGESLVKFLATRAKGKVEPKVLDKLLKELASRKASDRQKACQLLIAIGDPAVPKLRAFIRDSQPSDAVALATKLLKILDDDRTIKVTGAAIRLLAERRPPGAAEALLAYLPQAENENLMDDLKFALANVAHVNGKPNPTLLKALEDPDARRRANAIGALCASGVAEPRATLRKLLTDKSPSVRTHAALALAKANDAKAVSVLIALIANVPGDLLGEIDDFLSELAGAEAPMVAFGNNAYSREKARDAWAKWWLGCDALTMLKTLEKRALTEETKTRANRLIEKLGDDSKDVRQVAEADLQKMGVVIMPLLKAALKNQNQEIRNRSRKLLTALEADPKAALPPVVLRLIALRKPKGAAEAILAYVPFAEDELLEDLQTALNAVTFTNGKANPAVIKALTDRDPSRRGAAGAALCAGRVADHLGDIRKLLDPKTEKDNQVRLRVALALANASEKGAVPTLIRLIADMPADQASPAEDYLFRLARENPPKNLPDGADKNKDRAAAWQKWWDDNKQTVVMIDRYSPELRPRYLGQILLIQAKDNQVVELDRNNKPRVTITGLNNPWDAHWVSKNRLLITEYEGMRVTERDSKGEIKWEKRLDFYPMQAERLKNGHTFMVGKNRLVQVDRSGREVLRIDRNNYDVRSARRLPNGQIIIITSKNKYIRLDRSGKEMMRTDLPNVEQDQNEILDNGNVLVPLTQKNRLMEYNQDGKEIWSITCAEPQHAFRLPNRNALVSLGNGFITTNNKGKQISKWLTNHPVVRIKGR